jgi:UDP-GlcNAc:undecaprenyl-phosphate GlcNAc-1-phosphate transferase
MNSVQLMQWALGVTLGSAVVSYGFSLLTERAARFFRVLDTPTGGRKIHMSPVPLLGGVGIALTIIIMVSAIASLVIIKDIRAVQVIGFLVGISILLIGGMLDDVYSLSPRVQILFPVLATLAVIATGTGIIQVTHPLQGGVFSLVWAQWHIPIAGSFFTVSLPSDILTFVWIIVATYAMKILDGLDGLVTGMTVIGAGIVSALSVLTIFYQPPVALLSSIIGGAYLGFLPRNTNPAKQFLGESGSTIAGFSLAVLAILSGAKIALTLTVLAIPIVDTCVVVIGRMRRGVAWYKGDATHLHHRLMQAGISQRTVVLLYWGVSLTAGILALSLQTRGKIFLIILLCLLAVFASFFAKFRLRK